MQYRLNAFTFNCYNRICMSYKLLVCLIFEGENASFNKVVFFFPLPTTCDQSQIEFNATLFICIFSVFCYCCCCRCSLLFLCFSVLMLLTSQVYSFDVLISNLSMLRFLLRIVHVLFFPPLLLLLLPRFSCLNGIVMRLDLICFDENGVE